MTDIFSCEMDADSKLARILRNRGGIENLGRAKALLEKVLTAYRATDDAADLTNLAITKSDLALVLKDLGGSENLKKAKDILLSEIGITVNGLGEGHSAVALLRTTLSIILREIGGVEDLKEAKKLQEDALDSDSLNFGDSDPRIAYGYLNLASILRYIGGKSNLEEALSLAEKATRINVVNYGTNSPKVARAFSATAMILCDLGGGENLKIAENLLGQSHMSNLLNFGHSSPIYANDRSDQAIVSMALFRVFKDREYLENACRFFLNAVESDLKNFKEDHPSVARGFFNLAMVLKEKGGESNLTAARNLLERALKSIITKYGEMCSNVTRCRKELVNILYRLGGYENVLRAESILGTIRNSSSDENSRPCIPVIGGDYSDFVDEELKLGYDGYEFFR